MPLTVRCLIALAFLPLLYGCSSTGYYSQLLTGQWHVLQAREPVAKVVADPQRDPVLRQHLARSQAARTF
ncbi:MAG: aminopeptidase, partial [Pseudomonas sp.]|nr:aminopeptidase [Pseudomonas sp.]